MRPDIVGFDRNGHVKLVAEVNNRRGVSHQWVTNLRRNLAVNTQLPTDAYFLLILPDELHLWKPTATPDLDRNPDVSARIPEWFSGHTSSTGAREFSLFGWLSGLTMPTSPEMLKADPSWAWAVDSGLAETLRGGRVEIQS
jgi:hypothetical protein